MNKVILIGNLTRDPEVSTISSGAAVCKFSIAVNRRFGGTDGTREVDFFNIVAWRALGENCGKFLRKGSKVGVVGTIQVRNYEAKDGSQRTAVDINADEVEFLSPKGEGGSSTPSDGGAGEMRPVDDDNLPF